MNYMMLIKNRKAISPIFATLILIAIAVIAGVVVYTFTSGMLTTMTGGGTAGQEKITVQSAYNSSSTEITVILQQTGGPAATINGMILKDGSGTTLGTATTSSGATISTTLTVGTLTTMTGTFDEDLITDGKTYTVTMTTAAGGIFLSPTFTA